VAEAQELARAVLIELDAAFQVKSGGHRAKVQFNPDTLRVTYANQLAQQGSGGTPAAGTQPAAGATPAPSGDQTGGASRQYVGSSTTKLSLQLWFDVSGPRAESAADASKLTERVAYFIKPQKLGANGELLPPNLRFSWGSFAFDGTIDSLEETFEFFSAEGRPLRALLALTMSRQTIQLGFTEAGGPFARGPGTRPLTPVAAGATLQGLAAGAGVGLSGGAGWQAVAAANGIEDPLRLQPGQLVDLNLRASVPGL
jgi:hypothetical protein